MSRLYEPTKRLKHAAPGDTVMLFGDAMKRKLTVQAIREDGLIPLINNCKEAVLAIPGHQITELNTWKQQHQ